MNWRRTGEPNLGRDSFFFALLLLILYGAYFCIIIGSALFALVRALLDLYSQEYAYTDE